MQFIYHKNAGMERTLLDGQNFIHIYQSRRTKAQQNLILRNLQDDFLYTYEVLTISRKSATLAFHSKVLKPLKPIRHTHIIWAITDVKTIEKTLPFLNELGLGKLTLFWAHFSQKNQKPNLERLEKILIASCEQCGRSSLAQIEILPDIKQILALYPDSLILDFNGVAFEPNSTINLQNGILIGPEGGFSKEERALFAPNKIHTFKTSLILKSQTAAIATLSQNLF